MITSTYEAKCDRCSLQISSRVWPEAWVAVTRHWGEHDELPMRETLCAVCADSLREWFLTPVRPYSPTEYDAYVGSRIADWEYELLDHTKLGTGEEV